MPTSQRPGKCLDTIHQHRSRTGLEDSSNGSKRIGNWHTRSKGLSSCLVHVTCSSSSNFISLMRRAYVLAASCRTRFCEIVQVMIDLGRKFVTASCFIHGVLSRAVVNFHRHAVGPGQPLIAIVTKQLLFGAFYIALENVDSLLTKPFKDRYRITPEQHSPGPAASIT